VQELRKVTVKKKGKTVTVTKSFTRPVDEDFAWKDPRAAEKAGMPMVDYVIGGMDRSFKLKLFHVLHAAEQAGLSPGITSAFRDDYRQSIASGLPPGLSFVTLLPTRRLFPRFAQAPDPRWLLQPVTRRRLAAIGAVQFQPAFKFRISAFRAAISAACAAISAISSSHDGSAGKSAFMESLNPVSRKIYGLGRAKSPTQPGQRRK